MNEITLPYVDDRILKLERVVATIAEDFYEQYKSSSIPKLGVIEGLEQENRGLKAQVEHLRSVVELKDSRIQEVEGIELILRAKLENKQIALDDAQRDVDYWKGESESADGLADTYREELDSLRGKIMSLL